MYVQPFSLDSRESSFRDACVIKIAIEEDFFLELSEGLHTLLTLSQKLSIIGKKFHKEIAILSDFPLLAPSLEFIRKNEVIRAAGKIRKICI